MDFDLVVFHNIGIFSPRLEEIQKAFSIAMSKQFQQAVKDALLQFAPQYMENGALAKILKSSKVTWKTSSGNETTTVKTIFGTIHLPQLQVVCHDTGRRIFVTRLLLGIEPRKRIPEITMKYLGLFGALAPLRVVNKFLEVLTGSTVSLMDIVRSIRHTGNNLVFEISQWSTNTFSGDGTGLPILGAGKRGKELKILAQHTVNGRLRVAGMVLGPYKQGWRMLFAPLLESLKKFNAIKLITDGDTSILNGLSGVQVLLQRCLFHIPHELKYTLWKDHVKRKSRIWAGVMAAILEITNVRRVRADIEVAKRLIRWKRNLLTRLINYCVRKRLKHSVSFLQNAKPDMFSLFENKTIGGTTSLLERMMRTINQRINVAQWSHETALAVSKIRAAYYYNGFHL